VVPEVVLGAATGADEGVSGAVGAAAGVELTPGEAAAGLDDAGGGAVMGAVAGTAGADEVELGAPTGLLAANDSTIDFINVSISCKPSIIFKGRGGEKMMYPQPEV